jgi:hypothetical protein
MCTVLLPQGVSPTSVKYIISYYLLSPSDRPFAITYLTQTMFLRYTYNITATLCLQCIVHVMLLPMIDVLYFYITTFRSMCAAPSKVFCAIIICYSYERYLQLHLERTKFLRFIVLQLFSVYNSCHA